MRGRLVSQPITLATDYALGPTALGGAILLARKRRGPGSLPSRLWAAGFACVAAAAFLGGTWHGFSPQLPPPRPQSSGRRRWRAPASRPSSCWPGPPSDRSGAAPATAGRLSRREARRLPLLGRVPRRVRRRRRRHGRGDGRDPPAAARGLGQAPGPLRARDLGGNPRLAGGGGGRGARAVPGRPVLARRPVSPHRDRRALFLYRRGAFDDVEAPRIIRARSRGLFLAWPRGSIQSQSDESRYPDAQGRNRRARSARAASSPLSAISYLERKRHENSSVEGAPPARGNGGTVRRRQLLERSRSEPRTAAIRSTAASSWRLSPG